MSSNRLVKAVYRSLLRSCFHFERNPAAKCLIHRLNTSRHNFPKHYHHESSHTVYIEHLLERFLPGANFFHTDEIGTISLTHLVRQEFRDLDSDFSTNSRIDAALFCMRKLSSIWSTYKESKKTIDEAVISQINIQSSVSKTKAVFPGVILASHPLLDGRLGRSLILMLEHTQRGSYGIVINKPTKHSIKSGIRNLPKFMVSAFKDNPIYCGGDIRRLTALHPFSGCGGTEIPLCESPFFAGFSIDEAVELARLHSESKKHFHFFAGCCTWGPGQLDREIALGYWLPIMSQPDLIVKKAAEIYDEGVEKLLSVKDCFDDEANVIEEGKASDGLRESEGIPSIGTKSVTSAGDGEAPASKAGELIDFICDVNEQLSSDEHSVKGRFPFLSVRHYLWSQVLSSVGGHFAEVAKLPPQLTASKVESLDWND